MPSRFRSAILAGALPLLLSTPPAWSDIDHVDLSEYTLAATFFLPPKVPGSNPGILNAEEASGVTWNWDSDTLFVVSDDGSSIVEVDKTGVLLDRMRFFGTFDDPEGITYIGNDQLVIADERVRDARLLDWLGNDTVLVLATLPTVDLGSTVDNIGLEGISLDPRDGSFITVKEVSPQEVNLNTLDFVTETGTVTPLFVPALGVADIADVQVLATVPSLAGTADEDHLLILSQESARLLEVDRSGNVLSQFSFAGLSTSAEGVTIDGDGVIYVVDENGKTPRLFVLEPPPSPPSAVRLPVLPPLAALLLMLGCLGAGVAVRLRQRD